MAILRLIKSRDAFLSPRRFGIIAAADAYSQRTLKPNTKFEEICAFLVNISVLLIPQNVPALAVKHHDSLREHVDGFTQLLVCGFSAFKALR